MLEEQNQHEFDDIRQEVGELLQETISYHWLNGMAVPDVAVRPGSELGISAATIFRIALTLDFFAKYHEKDAEKEASGFRTLQTKTNALSGHLVAPIPIAMSSKLWITPYIPNIRLQNGVCDQELSRKYNAFITQLYEDFLDKQRLLWTQTLIARPPNIKELYIRSLDARMAIFKNELHLDNYQELQLRVQRAAPVSVGQLLARYKDKVRAISRSLHHACTIHADEHGNNILMPLQTLGSDPSGWLLIDYTNARRRSDWIYSIAKMYQWWKFYCILDWARTHDEIEGKLSYVWQMNGNTLTVEYDEHELDALIPDLSPKLAAMCIDIARMVAGDLGETDDLWRPRLNLALFRIIFGTMPLLLNKARFAVPIMLHKSLKALDGDLVDELSIF